jgi:hypothetical protein
MMNITQRYDICHVCLFKEISKFTKNHQACWGIGSFGVCQYFALREGANPKCANVGRLKLLFKMCVGKIFKTLCWIEYRKTGLGLCRVTANCQPSYCRQKVWSF